MKTKTGGFREGSGRKPKKYEVKQMGIRVPSEIFDDCVNICKEMTKKFEKSLQNQITFVFLYQQ